ncbi:hypothetical protein RRG08_040698 [Elysia crispata]|uniref:Uncharacterized protein n=1 Tax=Elysia crispata TaxID=231223 RepID=A0AAE1AXU8_9GAST|nr:hypothetical protein RRG08_040698 [Elysia crispata]
MVGEHATIDKFWERKLRGRKIKEFSVWTLTVAFDPRAGETRGCYSAETLQPQATLGRQREIIISPFPQIHHDTVRSG